MQEGRRWIGLARETFRGKRTLDVKGIDGVARRHREAQTDVRVGEGQKVLLGNLAEAFRERADLW